MPEIDTETDTDLQKTNSTRMIVRVSVGLLLAVLLVLALMDRSANTSANSTTDAWREELKTAAGENRPLPPSELSQHVVGNPDITGEPTEGLVVYTWSGTFRSYKTSVMYAGPNNPVVVGIEGPSL